MSGALGRLEVALTRKGEFLLPRIAELTRAGRPDDEATAQAEREADDRFGAGKDRP